MGARLMFLSLLFLSINWMYADARSLEISDPVDSGSLHCPSVLLSATWKPFQLSKVSTSDLVIILPVAQVVSGTESKVLAETVKNEKLCTLCEQFTTQAVEYLGDNKTQSEVIENLHHACFQLHSLKERCILLVDYYAPLFFMEVGLIRPEDFCKKVNLCGEMPLIHLPKHDDSCTICHHTVIEVLMKLKNPDTQLEIIETLLKACNKVEHFAQECKRLVLQYGPIILVNAEKFLETTDICVAIHACKADQKDMVVQSSLTEVSLSDA